MRELESSFDEVWTANNEKKKAYLENLRKVKK